MPVFKLDERLEFPPANLAEDGLLAVGGDLSPERLVLEAEALRLPRSLRKTLRQRPYRLTLDTAFAAVIEACARAPRPGQDGTWITAEMRDAYARLFELGLAHSVEAWRGEELVGGLYGVS